MAELIWEGKYDKDGRRVAPLRVALPFQSVETVNESAQQRQLSLERFHSGRDSEWRNRLIWGDKKYVLPSLLDEFAGQVDLIYIDPPFDTGADFSFQVQVDGESFTKEQAGEFGEQAEAKQAAYRKFILDLYKARPIAGHTWLHGLKNGRMVHVGPVDSPISPGDVAQIASEFRRAMGTGKDAPSVNGVDVLGWDFAFEQNEVARQQAAQANINMRFLRIPRDVMDKRAVEQGDVQFFELAALSADVQGNGLSVTVTLTDFVIPPDDVPEEVRKAISNWEQWVDYWSVDWDNKGDTFHNQWQDYRTRKKRTIQKSVTHTYDGPGDYTVVVKVIDILGNDTTKSLKVKVTGNASSRSGSIRAAKPTTAPG